MKSIPMNLAHGHYRSLSVDLTALTLATLTLVVLSATSAHAQSPVRAWGLGGAGGAVARGLAIGTGYGNLDKDYFDVVLYGNPVGQTVDFSNTWGEGSAMGAATVSFGTKLLTLGGASLASSRSTPRCRRRGRTSARGRSSSADCSAFPRSKR